MLIFCYVCLILNENQGKEILKGPREKSGNVQWFKRQNVFEYHNSDIWSCNTVLMENYLFSLEFYSQQTVSPVWG